MRGLTPARAPFTHIQNSQTAARAAGTRSARSISSWLCLQLHLPVAGHTLPIPPTPTTMPHHSLQSFLPAEMSVHECPLR